MKAELTFETWGEKKGERPRHKGETDHETQICHHCQEAEGNETSGSKSHRSGVDT